MLIQQDFFFFLHLLSLGLNKKITMFHPSGNFADKKSKSFKIKYHFCVKLKDLISLILVLFGGVEIVVFTRPYKIEISRPVPLMQVKSIIENVTNTRHSF